MQDANDDHSVGKWLIIYGVGTMKRDAQAGGKLLTGGSRQRKIPHWLKGGFDCRDEARGDVVGCPACDINPDFGEVGFGCIRQAKS